MFAFYFMFPFSFKFLQTSLIRKELIKHKNKFNGKKAFTIEKILKIDFQIFIDNKRLQKVYHEYFSVVYTMKLS